MEMQTWNAVVMLTDGGISHETYGSLDCGETWGLIAVSKQCDAWASVGHQWEAAIVGVDEYSPTIAQTWYASLEDAISSNLVDFDNPPSNVFARIDSEADWASYWEAQFEVAGYTSPAGRAFYRPKKYAASAV